MNDHEPKLSADLRVKLTQSFTLGFIEAMAGREVQDGDLVAGINPAGIEAAALACIAGAEDIIQATYIENPQAVHAKIYACGRWVYEQVALWAIQRN